MLPVAWAAVACAAGLVACANGSADQVTAPLDLGMTSSIAAYYDDGNLTLYQVSTPVALPVRRPTAAEQNALGPAPAGSPYPHAPFLRATDESVAVHFVLSNLDPTPHTVTMLVDPWNEFVRWNPGVTIVNDDTTTPNLGYDVSYRIEGKSRIEGDLTPDITQEIAIKLASAERVIAEQAAIAAAAMGSNGPGPLTLVNHIFDPHNWSNTNDPLFSPWVPPVIAGLTGFDLGLRLQGEHGNVAVEVTIEVQDLNGNRFVMTGDTNQLGAPPTVLSPPGALF